MEWNTGAQRLLGHTAGEVVGRPAVRLLAGGSRGPAGSHQCPLDGTVTLWHRDGRAVPVWLLAHHRHPRDGGPGDWLVVTPLEGGGPRADETSRPPR
ncbi:PAS domain-containing protein [Streptomyces sp. L7]